MSRDTELLQEIRDNRSYAESEWGPIRAEAKKDRLCVAGKPWQAMDPAGMKERQDAKRPFLAMDELGQYINQTVNDILANPRGIKYAATGNGANEQGAEFYQNHTREIEYRSQARTAFARAFENTVTSSYGWIRVRTKREHLRTFNQDLWIELVANPDQVLSDPLAVWPDSRDMKFLYYLEPWPTNEFQRRWPNAKPITPTLGKLAPGWTRTRSVDVGEYWRLHVVERKLVAYRVGKSQAVQTALVDELPDGKLPRGAENLREETVEDTKVRWYLTNGIEILEEPKWAGKYIPFVSCLGKVLYVDEGGGSQRQILSLPRLARDPYMVFCYMWTCMAEAVGAVPRSSFVGYEGQFAKPKRWQEANTRPVAYLEATVTVPGAPPGIVLPLPQKQGWDPGVQNVAVVAEAARRSIQAAFGITPLPTPTQRENQKSGEALKRIETSGQRGSYHFVNSYDLMIERTGVILEDLMDKTIDTARDVPIRKADDTPDIVRVNDPSAEDPIFTKGDYRVTVTTGPATESQRSEAKDFVDALMSNIAAVAHMAGSMRALKIFAMAVKLKQLGPIGDQIIELLDPPQPGKDGKPLPPEVAQLMGENQQLKQLLQQAAQEKQGKLVEQDGKFKIAQLQEVGDTLRAREANETKLAVAELAAKIDRLQLFYEERDRLGLRLEASLDRVHQALEARRDRGHATIEAARDRTHDRLLADATHEHAIEQGAAGVEGQMAVQDNAPPPEAEA
jgi:hypothetical protein